MMNSTLRGLSLALALTLALVGCSSVKLDDVPVEELDSMINLFGAPSLPTCATSGEGIYESLQKISEQVLAAFQDRLPESTDGRAPANFSAVEGGLINALRGATQRAEPPRDVIVAHIEGPNSYP